MADADINVDIEAIFDRIRDHHLQTERFEFVSTHEPKAAPVGALTAAIWFQEISPWAPASGLDATSCVLVLTSRVYINMLQQPEDAIDPRIAVASFDVIRRLTADLTLDGEVRNIDVLGQTGRRLEAKAGYLPQDRQVYRVMDLSIPVIVNDVFPQEI